MARQTRTVKVLGITIKHNIQRGIPLKYAKRAPDGTPALKTSRGLFKRSGK